MKKKSKGVRPSDLKKNDLVKMDGAILRIYRDNEDYGATSVLEKVIDFLFPYVHMNLECLVDKNGNFYKGQRFCRLVPKYKINKEIELLTENEISKLMLLGIVGNSRED